MTTQLDLTLNIRTEQSEQYSRSSNDFTAVEHSIDSVSFFDQSISNHIQQLQLMQERAYQKQKNTISSRSQSYILIQGDECALKKKSSSMKNSQRRNIPSASIPTFNLKQLLGYHRCLNLAKNDFYNRAYGAMFGFLIGDSIGAYLINKPYNQIEINQALLMKGGGVMNLKSGEGTDQWEICLSLCEGLVQCKGIYDQNVIASKYLQWLDSNPFDLPVLMGIAFSDIRRERRQTGHINGDTIGQKLRRSSLKNLKQESALGLIRIFPLVIWCINLEQYEFNSIIRQQMKLITPNKYVVETAIIFANLVKCILVTGDPMLAYHEASQSIYSFGSQKMVEHWNCIQENKEPVMTNLTANNLKYPLIFAVNQLLELDLHKKDTKNQFIQTAARIISKGYNTDTNCSIVLGLIGATLGYNSIPSYFKSKVINAQCSHTKNRSRDYRPIRVVQVVNQLIKSGPHHIDADFL